MTIQTQIEEKLNKSFQPTFMDIINESHMHNVPAGSESHFKIVLASNAFDGLTLIKRHRLVNEVLADELKGEIHAMALHTMTPDEYFEKAGKVAESPECMGGSK
jgi:BolA protein